MISIEEESSGDFDGLELPEVIAKGLLGFDAWTSLISNVEKTYPDDIEKISLVYDSFLSEFPLCYGYWRKYADHKTRLCTVNKVIEVYERALQLATYSVDLWVDYCTFSMSVFEDPFDVRRLFKRGLSFVGKDYLCHSLWDKYIEFEFAQQQWNFLANIYLEILKFPIKKLRRYYDSFKKFVAIWQEEIECYSNSGMELQSEPLLDSETTTYYRDDEISQITNDLLDPSIGSKRCQALQKYLSIGEQFYQKACQLDAKIHDFETHIRRPYFHVKPLDVSQLENWHRYLDFVEVLGDFDWAVKLYERCLIPCANYPEFWMRYVEFMEIKGGREIANFALDRSTKVFHKSIRAIHLFNAWFKEQTGDVFGARTAFLQYDAESDSCFIEKVVKEANMERRLGNFVSASNIFKEALVIAAEKQKLHTLANLYVHYSQIEYMITGSVDVARDILIDGIQQVPKSKILLEELIKFTLMHGGSRHMNLVDSIVANAIFPGTDVCQGLNDKDREDISSLYLEFVDLCGTIYDVMKAWNRHIKLFPHSLRTISIYKHPESGSRPLRIFMEGRQDTIAAAPHFPSGDFGFEHLDKIQIEDQEPSCPQNHDIEFEQVVKAKLQPEESNKAAEERFPKVPGQCREDASEQNGSDSVVKEYSEIESVQALLALSRANELQQEVDQESLQELKSLSLESLSINPQHKESPDSIPASSHDTEAPQEAGVSDAIIIKCVCNTDPAPSTSSPVHTSAEDSGQIHIESAGPSSSASPQIPTPTEELSQSPVPENGGERWHHMDSTDKSAQIQMSPERHKNPLPTQAISQPQSTVNGGGNWHQMNTADKVHWDSSPKFRGHSRNRKRVSRHVPLEQQYSHDQISMQMLMNQGSSSQPFSWQNPQNQPNSQVQHPCQTAGQGNTTTNPAWPMQILQQQNFAPTSPCQLPAQPGAYPPVQVSQYPMQNNEQQGQVQNSQAYNQMWQYYYYQQQQQQQQYIIQQQQLQLQHQLQQESQQQQQLKQPQHNQQAQQSQEQQSHQQQQPQHRQQQQQPLPPQQSQEQQSHQQQHQQQSQQQHPQQAQEQQSHQQRLLQQQQLELQQHYLQMQQQFQHQQNHQQQLQLQQQQQYLFQQQLQQQQSYQQQQQHLLYLQQLQQQLQQQQLQQQHQQHQQPPQQKEDQEQPQQQPLITPEFQQAWNNNYYQQQAQQASLQYHATSNLGVESNQQTVASQVQGVTRPGSSSSSEHAVSPNPQQRSPMINETSESSIPIDPL